MSRALAFLRRNEDRILRAFVGIGAAIILAGLIAGCASVADDIDFMTRTAAANATPSPNFPPLVIEVDDPDYVCRGIGATGASTDGYISGCADYVGRVNIWTCTIIVGKDAPEWVRAHERLHCRYGAWHK